MNQGDCKPNPLLSTEVSDQAWKFASWPSWRTWSDRKLRRELGILNALLTKYNHPACLEVHCPGTTKILCLFCSPGSYDKLPSTAKYLTHYAEEVHPNGTARIIKRPAPGYVSECSASMKRWFRRGPRKKTSVRMLPEFE